MNGGSQASWDDEKRWDYAHQLLSMEMVLPLYDYIGIPFQGESAAPFQQLLRGYVHDVYVAPSAGTVFSLADKQHRLLRAIDNAFNSKWREEYASWFLHVFVYTAGEHMAGWSQWRTIFMRCSVRSGWWPRLNLAQDKNTIIQGELSDSKTRMEDARELARAAEKRDPSDWDRQVMARMGIDEEAKEAGEPFNRILLTASLFMFYLFWVRLLKVLLPDELETLWKSARALARDLDIRPEDVPHPNQLQLIPS